MSIHQRRQREAEARRSAILHAARKLFWKQGYAATTMPQLATACELAPSFETDNMSATSERE